MDPAAMKPWMDLIVSYGVPLIITAGFLWLLWRYIPPWIDSSIKAQTRVPDELNKLNDTLTEGLQDVRGFRDDIHQLKQAVQHGAAAGEAAVSGKPATEVAVHLSKMSDSVK
jgi:hypothetical protein